MDFTIIIFDIMVLILNGTLFVKRTMEGSYGLAMINLVSIFMIIGACINLYISHIQLKREYEEIENNWKNLFELIEK